VIFLSAVVGITRGARSLLAFNFGAKNYFRFQKIFKRLTIFILIYLVAVEIIVFLFGEKMLLIFGLSKTTLSNNKDYI
jgi:Na+-driven multidrug efflux pump